MDNKVYWITYDENDYPYVTSGKAVSSELSWWDIIDSAGAEFSMYEECLSNTEAEAIEKEIQRLESQICAYYGKIPIIQRQIIKLEKLL